MFATQKHGVSAVSAADEFYAATSPYDPNAVFEFDFGRFRFEAAVRRSQGIPLPINSAP